MLQTRIKNRLVRRGIVALALLAVLPGCTTNGGTTDERWSSTPVVAEQTFDEAEAAFERGDYDTAMQGFRVHAEQGNAEAQLNLGQMYDRRPPQQLGCRPEDDAEAARPRWFRKAAVTARRLCSALRALAARGVLRLPDKVRPCRKAAPRSADQDKETPKPSSTFGECTDDAEAARWYRKAADQGHSSAQYSLGIMCAYGKGVPENGRSRGRCRKTSAEAVTAYRMVPQRLRRARERLRAIRQTPKVCGLMYDLATYGCVAAPKDNWLKRCGGTARLASATSVPYAHLPLCMPTVRRLTHHWTRSRMMPGKCGGTARPPNEVSSQRRASSA